eukprot:3244392-Ditylum_brightwellii.AAC.1
MGDYPSSTEGDASGIHLLHDCYILERLADSIMSIEWKTELLKCIGDILALPNTLCASGEDALSDLAHVADLLHAVVATSSGVAMSPDPSVAGIQNQGCTALGKVWIKEDLDHFYKVLASAQHEVIAGMLASMSYASVREGYTACWARQKAQSCLPY